MWRLAFLALLLLPGTAAAQDASADAIELLRQHQAEARQQMEESDRYMMEAIFSAAIPADQQIEREIIFVPSQRRIWIFIDKRLAQAPSPSAVEPLDFLEILREQTMAHPLDVKLRPDGDIFNLRCFAGSGDTPFCTFSAPGDSPTEGYAIPGEWFAISGDGCIHSRAGSWQTMGTPYDVSGVNCLKNGTLRPILQPLTKSADGGGI